jgi:hypothetical protein
MEFERNGGKDSTDIRGQGVLNIYLFGFVLIPIPVHCVVDDGGNNCSPVGVGIK